MEDKNKVLSELELENRYRDLLENIMFLRGLILSGELRKEDIILVEGKIEEMELELRYIEECNERKYMQMYR